MEHRPAEGDYWLEDEACQEYLELLEELVRSFAVAGDRLEQHWLERGWDPTNIPPFGKKTTEQARAIEEAIQGPLQVGIRLNALLRRHSRPRNDGDEDDLPSDWHAREASVAAALTAASEKLGRYTDREHPRAQGSPSILSAFVERRGLIPSSLAIQGVLASLHAAQDPTRGWRNGDSDLPVFEFARGQGTARVLMRPDTNTTPNQAVAELLWSQVREFSDKDGDVLLAMMAQAMEPGRQDNDGATWITAAAILDYRGIRPIMKREGKVTRRAGHRTEDLAEITACVSRLGAQWVELVSVETRTARRGKRQPMIERTSYESKLFSIDEQIMQGELGGARHAIAWRYRLGRCITEFLTAPNRQVARLMQHVLEYDPYRQSFEKRLGRYFTIHHRIGASYKAPLRRKVSGLFDELYLPINKSDPSRTMKRFEMAMDRLVSDGVLPGWVYTAESAARVQSLPARGWLSGWLSCVVEIPIPKAALGSPGNA